MPKETFFRLPEEKRERILHSATQEFFRVPFREASINQIVRNAEIPRGSFYQYFEDKNDIFLYVLSLQHEKIIAEIRESIQKNEGDIFRFIENFVDKIEKNYHNEKCEKIMRNLMNPETYCVISGMLQGEKIYAHMEKQLNENLIQYIDFSLYDLKTNEEKVYFMDLLSAMMQYNFKKLIQVEHPSEESIGQTLDGLRKRLNFIEKHFRDPE